MWDQSRIAFAIARPSPGLFQTSPARFTALIESGGGLPTVVNVWASRCIPCRREAPLLRQSVERHGQHVRFVGLNTKDGREDASAFIKEFGLAYPSGFDPDGKVVRHLRVLGLPATLFYRRDGELGAVHAGEIQADQLEAKIQSVLMRIAPLPAPGR